MLGLLNSHYCSYVLLIFIHLSINLGEVVDEERRRRDELRRRDLELLPGVLGGAGLDSLAFHQSGFRSSRLSDVVFNDANKLTG